MTTDKAVCRNLPISMVDCATTSADRDDYVINLLEKILPGSDKDSIADEIRKPLTLHKYKSVKQQSLVKKKKQKFLTARKRNLLGLNKLERRSELKYADALALNRLWLQYVKQMLGVDRFQEIPRQPVDPKWESVGCQLLKADYHGARIEVVKSKCPSLVGIRGIVLQETKSTFRAIGEDDVVRTIPKESCVFNIHLSNVYLQLFGKEMCIRPAERSVKKFKSVHMPDL